jgi:phosphate transport system substrate-binding protein
MSSSGTGTTPPAGGEPTQAQPTMQRKSGNRGVIIAVIAIVVIVIIIIGVGYGAGWFKSSTSPSSGVGCTLPSAGTLKGEGSTLVAPLVDQWATSYWTGSVLTSYDAAGSSSGIQAITTKTVDFGASDAPLSYAQAAAASGVVQIPEAAGGVVPIYNLPGLSAALNFNGSVLAQIFDGQITNWNNTPLQTLNPHVVLPVATIGPVYRTGGSGTTFIFTSFLTLENAYWASHYGKNLTWPSGLPGVGESGNGGVASTVSTTTDSIGYVDLNYALNSGSSIGIGDVQNPSGNFIRATVANTESALLDSKVTLPTGSQSWYNVSFLNAPGAGDYPITSLTYFIVWQDLSAAYPSYTLASAENLADFLMWAITTGQSWSAPLYYAPIPTSVFDIDNATIHSLTFDGSAVPVCVPSGGAAPA